MSFPPFSVGFKPRLYSISSCVDLFLDKRACMCAGGRGWVCVLVNHGKLEKVSQTHTHSFHDAKQAHCLNVDGFSGKGNQRKLSFQMR